MRKRVKIFCVITLTLALILSFTACKKTSKNNQSEGATPQNSQSASGKAEKDNKSDTSDKTQAESENRAFNASEGFYRAYKAGATDEKALISASGYEYIARYYADGNDKYTLILRKNNTTEEKLYQFSGSQTVTYAKDSYEKSSERNIYLCLADEYNYYDGYNTKLAVINCESGVLAVLYDKGVSQMVICENPPKGFENIGWILNEKRIVPINLYDGSELSARVFDISKEASLPEISGSFFYYTSAGYEVKTSELESDKDGKLKIKVSEYVTDNSIEPSIINYIYDFESETITRIN